MSTSSVRASGRRDAGAEPAWTRIAERRMRKKTATRIAVSQKSERRRESSKSVRLPPGELSDLVDQREHRQVHRDDDAADDDAEAEDHDGLEQLDAPGDGDVHLVLVEFGDLVEHRVQGARLLADADHLDDHVREDLRVPQRLDDGLAVLDGL